MQHHFSTRYPDLMGKTAVVTGSSSGIGEAMARHMGAEGMNVVINYFTADDHAIEGIIYLIEQAGGQAVAIKADVGTEQGVQKIYDTAIETFGDLDVCVNNAGFEMQSATHEVTYDDWQRVIHVDMDGVFLGTKIAINHFLTHHKPGNILNTSSIHDVIPWPTYASYATAKAGVLMFTKTTALEYADQGIRINAISPGALETPINAKRFADPAVRQETTNMIPMKRIGDPIDVANAAVWLISSEAAYITGTTLYIDGGMTLYNEFQGGRG
ncbi:glucose 1-dehydrogenase [Weissella diestrammenae]|uniref:Glucose 1-dehydrogenase n=1 Tax=Weissella diestrammenae TaxID=1162633 RepID=A0A7G9T7R6_9LACO|nr:glucose 1-dehydrogenase [Weissella diestrammenae]MCM0583167.1 glucose 1-dehydrogenase [Weissella diestrammenae]QNN76141.1 glucose 1-dehydrogenase [Weissella diestrammenae]